MKRILTDRPAPLLIVVPLILFLLHTIFFADPVLDASVFFWMAFAFVILPFLLHFLLKASGKWDPVVCRVHVYVTISVVVLLFTLLFVNTNSNSYPQQYGVHSVAQRLTDLWNYNKIFSAVFFAGLFVQLLFTIYYFVSIFQKPAGNPYPRR